MNKDVFDILTSLVCVSCFFKNDDQLSFFTEIGKKSKKLLGLKIHVKSLMLCLFNERNIHLSIMFPLIEMSLLMVL